MWLNQEGLCSSTSGFSLWQNDGGGGCFCYSVTLWGGFSGGSPLILCLSMALPSRSTLGGGGGLKDVGKCVDKTSTER